MNYNAHIHHLMATNRDPRIVDLCDKAKAKLHVPADMRIPAPEPGEYPRVLKCNHDSGSATVVHNKAEHRQAISRLSRRLPKDYAAGTGEWAYILIQPRVIVEERYMPCAEVDYKFHCVDGTVRWCQAIWDRNTKETREAVLLPDGFTADFWMDEKMHPAYYGIEQTSWERLINAAHLLSLGHKYVRIDLYYDHNADRVYFGEFTFWPRGGNYRFKDPAADAYFGSLLTGK